MTVRTVRGQSPSRTSPRSRRVRRAVAALGVGAVGILAVVVLAAVLQRTFIYHPDTTRPGSVVDRVAGARDVVLPTEDGLALDAWLLPPTGSDRDVAVLYLPGNGGNRGGRVEVAEAIAARGFTVLLLEYRGYGGNDGSPSEEGLARDARAAAAFLDAEGFDPDRTLYVAESLGTGVAAGLVATHPPAGVVLRSPFTSFVDVAEATVPVLPVGLILRDRYPAADHLRDSDVPVVVLHGDADDVVPSRLSARLASQVGNLHDEVVLAGVGHNDEVWFGPFLADAVAALADDVIDEG